MAMGSSMVSAVKLSMVKPEYFLGRLVRLLSAESSSEPKRLRLKVSISAWPVPAGFRGVLVGVRSMLAEDEAVAFDVEGSDLGFRPKAAAALAVPSAVKGPDARRTESAAGWRFFLGDISGDSWSARFLRGDDGWREARGEGVLLVLRSEILADLRGE